MLIPFLLLALICFTFPGAFLLSKTKTSLSFWEEVILGTAVGLIFFTLLSYLLLVINLHFLLIPIIFIFALLYLKQYLFKLKIPAISRKRFIILLVLFTLGVVGQLLIIAPSGVYLNGDLIFWSSHGHDGLWHISLMNEYNQGFPMQNPVFAGEKLVNYHFFSDIAPADFNHYFKLPKLDLYFRFFPLLFSTLLGALAYLLGAKLGGNFQTGVWAVIFTYFAGSFGYVVTFLQNRTFGGESLFWASQIQSSIGNPPQIAAFIIVLAFLYLFSIFQKIADKYIFTLCIMLAGSLVAFKVYGAIVILASLGLAGLAQAIKDKRFNILILFSLSSLLSALLYLPNSQSSSSFLIWEPWWFIRTMVVAPDRLNWLDLELRRQTYIYESNWKRVLQLEITAFLIFFFGNLGTRFLGLLYLPKFLKTFFNSYLTMIITLICLVSLLFPLFFLQKGVASNTIQFLQYFLLLFGILSAITVNEISKRVKIKFLNIALAILVIFLSVPTQLSLINSFYNRLPFAKIEKEELSALKFLRENSNETSIILTPPYNKYLNLSSPVPQIWDWSDTSYVAALSERSAYLEDTEQVDIMGYKLNDRAALQELIFSENDPQFVEQKLKEETINYLYFPIALKPKADLTKTALQKVFTNSTVEIWRVD